MKKVITFVIIAAVAMTFTSCKKDYTCTCTYTDNTGVSETVTGTIHGTKSQAQSACNTESSSYSGIAVSGSVKCSL